MPQYVQQLVHVADYICLLVVAGQTSGTAGKVTETAIEAFIF